MKQGGQTSFFRTVVTGDTVYFEKAWDSERYNPHSLLFQMAMENLDIPLKINKVIANNNKEQKAIFEYINEKPWNLDISKARLIGESMAKIHNWANTSKEVKKLNIPEKTSLYDNMDNWNTLDMGRFGDSFFDLKLSSKVLRNAIVKSLEDEGIKMGVNPNQPKVATHRDFKKHNIISDGKDLHLIDFDFTATEYVSLEIMAFLTDCIIERNEPVDKEMGGSKENRAKICIEFLLAYKRHSKLDIIWESVLYDYLSYLCSNTFPWYFNGARLKGFNSEETSMRIPTPLKEHDIKTMGQWRTVMANYLFENRKKLTKALTI